MGARANQPVLSQEKELKCLGKNDVIVINGGANDIDKPNGKANEILALMINFIQKYTNTNTIIVNIPHRHDLANVAKTNSCIQAYNALTKKHFEGIQTCFPG
jgi:lysophospholipase L1-like esterase